MKLEDMRDEIVNKRKSLGYTKELLSKEMETSWNVAYNFENSKSTFKFDNLVKSMNILNVSALRFLNMDNNEKSTRAGLKKKLSTIINSMDYKKVVVLSILLDKTILIDLNGIRDYLTRKRLARGVRQENLAEYLGISLTHMSNIETHKANPSLKVLDKMIAASGVDAPRVVMESMEENDFKNVFKKKLNDMPIHYLDALYTFLKLSS